MSAIAWNAVRDQLGMGVRDQWNAHDEDLVVSGDFVEVLWFQGFTEYLQPGK